MFGPVALNLVKVVEAWDNCNKRHVCCCANYTFFNRKWDDDCFILKLDCETPVAGYWAPGLAERLTAIQKEITYTMESNQVAQRVGSKLHVVKPGSVDEGQMPKEAYTDEELTVWPEGVTVTVPDPVSPQRMAQPAMLADLGYRQEGINQMEAAPDEPAVELSGKAVRSYERFGIIRQNKRRELYELNRVRLVKALLKLVSKLAKAGQNVQALVRETNALETINWADAKMPDEDYRVACYKTANLPRDPAGRLQHVQELIGMGAIDPYLGMQLLDTPDVEKAQNIKLAALRFTQWQMDSILYKGEYQEPDEMQDLPLGMDWCTAVYQYAKMHGADEDRLRLLVQWKVDAQNTLDRMMLEQAKKDQMMQRLLNPQAPAPGAAPGPMPPAAAAPVGGAELPEGIAPEAAPPPPGPPPPVSGAAGVPPTA
jgi:hypothetical protein